MRVFSLAREEPAGSEKIFRKVEDCLLTVLRDTLLCSSRNTGSGSTPGVLPFRAHWRADRLVNPQRLVCVRGRNRGAER